MFSFFKETAKLLHSGCPILHSHQQRTNDPDSPIPDQLFGSDSGPVLLLFFVSAILVGAETAPHDFHLC